VGAFDKIYEGNFWGFGSGHGSLPAVTRGYRDFIEKFLQANKIRSVVDYGCGDWQFSRLIDWKGAHYTGLDIAKKVIESNNQKYASGDVEFLAIEPSDNEIPSADLLITKDVLQHLTRNEIERFLRQCLKKNPGVLLET